MFEYLACAFPVTVGRTSENDMHVLSPRNLVCMVLSHAFSEQIVKGLLTWVPRLEIEIVAVSHDRGTYLTLLRP